MESGLEDRNNLADTAGVGIDSVVSMESGLEDRNNPRELLAVRSSGEASQWSPA